MALWNWIVRKRALPEPQKLVALPRPLQVGDPVAVKGVWTCNTKCGFDERWSGEGVIGAILDGDIRVDAGNLTIWIYRDPVFTHRNVYENLHRKW